MSVDEAVLCAGSPLPLTSYVEREGLRPDLVENAEGGAWGGTFGGALWWLETREIWDEEDRQRYDRWLGATVHFKVGINYRGSALVAGGKTLARVARRIAHEADGIYVSLDEARVRYSPKSAARKKQEASALRETLTDALEHLERGDAARFDALVAETAKLKSKHKAKKNAEAILRAITRLLAAELTSTEPEPLARAADAAARAREVLARPGRDEAWLGFDLGLTKDALARDIAAAYEVLGALASDSVRRVAEASAQELAKREGAAWAEAHVPSTVGTTDIVRRALSGELHALGVIYRWRGLGFGRWLLKKHPALATLPLFAEEPMP